MLSFKDRVKDVLAVVLLWFMIMLDDIKEIITTVVITFLVALIVNNFFFIIVVVSGNSMHPSVKDGSYGFSSIVSRHVDGIQRFDIVVINSEERGKNLIKRVIGLPGESIEYRNGQLYIDGKEYEESFLDKSYVDSYKTASGYFTDNYQCVLGENEYLCLGDNRPISADSRIYGPFKSEEIVAKGIFVIYPFDEFGGK